MEQIEKLRQAIASLESVSSIIVTDTQQYLLEELQAELADLLSFYETGEAVA